MTSLEPHSSQEVGWGGKGGRVAFNRGRRLANCMVAPQDFLAPLAPTGGATSYQVPPGVTPPAATTGFRFSELGRALSIL